MLLILLMIIIYMYYSESNVTNGAKKTIDTWYSSTLETNFGSYIATTNFCEAAKVKYDSSHTSGNATMELASNYTPNFECPLDGNGKQYVNAKAGLITFDEVIMVGKTDSYFLNYVTLTMSPAGFNDTSGYARAYVWRVNGGDINYYNASYPSSVYPVISLKANTLVTGTGESDNMWVVQ